MLCSRFLRQDHGHGGEKHGKPKRELFILRWFEADFNASLNGYGRSLGFVLQHRFAVLLLTFGTILLTGYLYVMVPKGFFPNEDTGQILVVTEAPQDLSFDGLAKLQQEAAATIQIGKAAER